MVLPKALAEDIARYIERACKKGENGFQNAYEDEDTITGDFLGSLRSDWKSFSNNRGRWRWKIEYKKFRGRGKNAFESSTGSDGIIQITALNRNRNEVVRKGLLFQAKKNDYFDPKLYDQCSNMEKIARNGSAIFIYKQNKYEFLTSSDFLEGEYDMDLLCFSLKEFLRCKHGLINLYWDFESNVLHLVDGREISPTDINHILEITTEEN